MPNPTLSLNVLDDATEVQIRLRTDELPSFFEWFDLWFEALKKIAVEWYEALLRLRLKRDLGKRYGRENRFSERQCPECGCRRASRKGSRPRQIEVPRLGRCSVRRPYVECRECGRSWAPYDEQMELEPRRRYQGASLLRPLHALLKVSYASASRLYPESPSPMTLWRFVQRHQPPLRSASPKDGTCVVDHTYIPGDGPRGQMPIGVAHTVNRGPDRYGRATLRRGVVAAFVGGESRMRSALRRQNIDTLLHDGALSMRGIAQRPARCRWHVPYTVENHTLYKDGIKGERRKELAEELRELVYKTDQPRYYAGRIFAWLDLLDFDETSLTRRFLERAVPSLLRPLREPQAYTVVSTSPIEREMREVNRRMENGSHWSEAGAENFLQHHQVQRHEPRRYTNWIKTTATGGAQKQKVSQT